MRCLRRRLARVEESIPLPLTAERFIERAQRHARRCRGTLESSLDVIARELTDAELESVLAECEEILYGSDLAARDAARSRALAAGRSSTVDTRGLE